MKDNNILRYKGYYTKVEFDLEDQILHGKIEGVQDLVNWECESAAEVEETFHEAVDDYLLFCEDQGMEPNKVYNGVFNIRISPELHRVASMEAANEGITLNQLVANALKNSLQIQ